MGVLSPATQNRRSSELRRSRAQATWVQGLMLIGSDILSLTVIYVLTGGLGLLIHTSFAINTVIVWGAVWILWRAYQGLYPGFGRSPQTELRLHVVGTFQLLAVQLAAALAIRNFPTDSATGTVIAWTLLLLIALPLRSATRSLLVQSGRYGRPVTIIGAGHTASLTIAHLQNHPSFGLTPLFAYDDNVALHGTAVHGIPVIGSIEQALTDPLTQQALISIPGARAETQKWLVNSVYAVFPYTWVIPDLFGVPNQALRTHNIGSIASLEIRNNLGSAQAQVIKRSIDLIGAGVGGLLMLPIVLSIALLIKLDTPGPAVYRARRLGRNGQPFDCFKFRSMHQDASEKLDSLLASDHELQAEFEATHKLKCDPRVTRVGAFLRKTSLDELPQLANVLLGTMSLVGPRPIVEAEISKYGDIYATYKQVRPGMTGYWQANGRSDTTYDERVGMDNFYITNWSPWLDIVILIQTYKVVVVGRGAY